MINKLEQGASITAAVYERLRADILACRKRPGERLRPADISSGLGVSLGAVREALSRLTSDGLVVAEAQRGFAVAAVSEADLRDLTHVRIEIESMALSASIQNGDLAWETGLVAAHHRLAKTPERADGDGARLSDDWATAHGEFHAALVAGCQSVWLLRLRAQLYEQSERYRRYSLPLARVERDVASEHRAIAHATLERDESVAVELLAAHMQTTTTLLLESTLWDNTVAFR